MKKTKKKKVLLIGWDAADWKVITPLLDAGKMPNLEKFVNEGVMGNLATLSPSLSPMLWTSIATGKRPFKHGVLGFTEPSPQGKGIRPISNFSRKTRAIWNMINLKSMKSNVVGWWPSHPVEPINGVMVSNHYQRAHSPIDKPWPLQPGTVHPPKLTKNLARLRLHPQEIKEDVMGLFVPEFAKMDQEKDRRLESIAKIIADCTSIHAAATALMQIEPWDFMGIYYDAIDHFGHGFMRYHPPRMQGVSEQDFELFKGVVESGYRFHDMMLGTLLTLAGKDTNVMLISDHGFHPDHMRLKNIPVEPAGPAAQHRQHGIIVMKGPDIKKDEIIHGASLIDITPTILHMYGLPIGEDMDGVPLVNAFIKPGKVRTIPSWDDLPGEDGSHPEDTVVDPMESQDAIDQLVELGYIEKPDDDTEKAVKNCVRELEYNLARSYIDANRHFDAVNILERLIGEWPDESRFGIQLYMCYKALGRIPDAGKALKDLFKNKERILVDARKKLKEWKEQNKDVKQQERSDKQKYEMRMLMSRAGRNPFAMEYLMAVQMLAEGDAETSLKHLAKAEKIRPESAELHIKKGEAFLELKEWSKAEDSFREALKIYPESPSPHLGLCRAYIGSRKSGLAVEQALAAIAFDYLNPGAHYLLGVALHRMRRPLQAIEALKVAVLQNPNHFKALKRLAYIFGKRLKDQETANDYRDQAKQARQRIRDLRSGKTKPGSASCPKRTVLTSDQDVLEIDSGSLDKITAPVAETIAIVSGLPRSGTSMMMQVLSAGGIKALMDEHRPADTHNVRGYFEDARAKAIKSDKSWLHEARGKAVKIVAQLLSELPADKKNHYGIIFMVRDLNEVVASQRDMLSAQGKKGSRMPDDVLQNTYINQLQRARKLLAIRKIPTLYVRYTDCINDPAAEASRINAFFGGSLDEAAMAASVDPKLYRHKKKTINNYEL